MLHQIIYCRLIRNMVAMMQVNLKFLVVAIMLRDLLKNSKSKYSLSLQMSIILLFRTIICEDDIP